MWSEFTSVPKRIYQPVILTNVLRGTNKNKAIAIGRKRGPAGIATPWQDEERGGREWCTRREVLNRKRLHSINFYVSLFCPSKKTVHKRKKGKKERPHATTCSSFRGFNAVDYPWLETQVKPVQAPLLRICTEPFMPRNFWQVVLWAAFLPFFLLWAALIHDCRMRWWKNGTIFYRSELYY